MAASMKLMDNRYRIGHNN